MIVVAAVLGFIALAVVFVGLTIRDARLASAKQSEALGRLGFSPAPSKTESKQLASTLNFVNARAQGKRLVMNLHRKIGGGDPNESFVCDLHFSSAGGRGSGGKWLIAGATNRGLEVQKFQIDSLYVEGHPRLTKLAQSLATAFKIQGMKSVETGDAEFDAKFQLSIEETQTGFHIPPAAIALIKQSGGRFSIYGMDSSIVVARPEPVGMAAKSESKLNGVQTQLHLATELLISFLA